MDRAGRYKSLRLASTIIFNFSIHMRLAMSKIGKSIRLERILDRKTHRTVVVPMDHGISVVPHRRTHRYASYCG